MDVLLAAYGALIAAVFASFFCVVAERVPAGESLMGRSRCVCGRQLSAAENIPIVSWLALRSRSRCCGATIPARYVLAEAGCAAVGFVSVVAFGVGVAALVAVALSQVAVVALCWPRTPRP
jgi:prepilin signal peptidase PulO-like enzyme (type II secretory pathway)